MADERGRPATTKEQFDRWLDEMRPHLVLGCSLNRAIEKAGLDQHAWVIFAKYRLGDYFSQKIDKWRATPGENANEAYVRLINGILDKVKTGTTLTSDEKDLLKHFSEKHRTAQPFFVSRTETTEGKREDLGKILEIIGGDYDEFGGETNTAKADAAAEEQKVADDASVQGQEQVGTDSHVSAEQNTTAPSAGAQESSSQPHP